LEINLRQPLFLSDIAGLYNFSWSLLISKPSEIPFDSKKSDRKELIEWKNALENAINHFNVLKSKSLGIRKFHSLSFITLFSKNHFHPHPRTLYLKSLPPTLTKEYLSKISSEYF